ncbi:MAG: betaine--homocysteine S-methyltransferase [Acidimicrobiales bacterium]|nr:betaine--homocysteine S-methyltransferase [Acidimicrobiales bacterium]
MNDSAVALNPFLDLLRSDRPLLADGAMGTSLFALGLISGDCPERWNIETPQRVVEVHRGYIRAGCDIILTNSFGGNGYRLKLHGLEGQVHQLNEAAAQLACSTALETDRSIVVAGSMGPTGELLEPMGTMSPEACAAAYADQAKGLDAGGVDVLWLETLSDIGEVRAALAGIRSVSELPVVVTMSFDTNGRTMMGLTATDMAEELLALGVDAFGANCGNNLADTEEAVRQLMQAAPQIPIVSKANAGIPQWHDDGLVYSGTPEVMAAHAHRLHELGVRIIGGCCGSTQDHIATMRQVIDGELDPPDIPAPRPEPRPTRTAPSSRRTRRGRAGRG